MIRIYGAGIFNSQISYKNIKKSSNRRTTTFELELPIEDEGISYIDNIATPVSRSTVICAKPNQIRCTQFPFKCYYIHLNTEDEALCRKLSELPDFIRIENRKELEGIFHDLCRYYNTHAELDELMLHSLVLRLVYVLHSNTQKYADCGRHSFNPSINKAIKYINANIEGDLSLQNVADYVALAPTYFHSCFKRSVGKTLREYVEDVRLKHSINLMLTSDMTLTEIAYNSGFSSQSYYSSVFKRKLGCTPRSYIKRLNDRYSV